MPAFAGMTMMFLSIVSFANQTTHNLYDANGYLISSCSNESGCSYLVYKGLSQGGSIKAGKYKHYIPGPQGKLAVIDKDETQSSQTLTWLTTDFHNSVMVSSVGSTPQQNMLDAFGNDLRPESSFIKEKIYTDKHPVDDADSLYNFNARFYDPEIGRFTITDPIVQDNLNWFTAFNNNPLSFVDPDGKNPRLESALKVAPKALVRIGKNPVIGHYLPGVAEKLRRSEGYYEQLTSQHGPVGQGIDWVYRSLIAGAIAAGATGSSLLKEAYKIYQMTEDESKKPTRAPFDPEKWKITVDIPLENYFPDSELEIFDEIPELYDDFPELDEIDFPMSEDFKERLKRIPFEVPQDPPPGIDVDNPPDLDDSDPSYEN